MPLISRTWRVPAAVLCIAAAAVLTTFVLTFGHRGSTRFDTWAFEELYAHVSTGAAGTLLGFSTPQIGISLAALAALVAALVRRWDVAALAALGPTVTVVVTEFVLKPTLGRALVIDGVGVTGVFPSGHESVVASTACVLAVVVWQLPMGRGVRAVVLTMLGAWTVLAALGLVRNFWHYATDTIGAACLSVAVVLGMALAIDAVAGRRAGRRDARPAADALAPVPQLTWRS
jgi:membrane-associated phospholipid phosphatase